MSRRRPSFSAAAYSSARSGCARVFFQAIFANSNGRRPGACTRDSDNWRRTASASGSPNAIAPSADASMTLSDITHLPDDVHRAGTCGEFPLLPTLVQFVYAQPGVLHRFLEDDQELTLTRPMMML